MFEGRLQCVFKAQFWSADCTHAYGQLAVVNSLGEATVVHAVNMASPPELRAHQDGVDALHLTSLEHFGVWDFVLPPNTEQGSETLS